MHQFDIAKELFRLATILEAKGKTALAKAQEHAQAKRLDDWRKEIQQSESATHFVTVLREAAEKLKPHGRKSPPFEPPTWEDLCAYVKEKHPTWPMEDVDSWFKHFETVNWVVGDGKPMKNWRAAADNGFRRWQARKGTNAKQRNLLPTGAIQTPKPTDPPEWQKFLKSIGRPYKEYRYEHEMIRTQYLKTRK